MSKRAVVTFPALIDSAAWDEIQAVRDRFDPLARAIAAHLTLVFPFDDSMSDSALNAHVRRIAAGSTPFQVTLRGVTAHQREYLFLNVKSGNDALIRLHDALYSEPLAQHHDRRHTYFPHLTIGRVSPEHLDEALAATSELSSALMATVESLSICRIGVDAIHREFEVALRSG